MIIIYNELFGVYIPIYICICIRSLGGRQTYCITHDPSRVDAREQPCVYLNNNNDTHTCIYNIIGSTECNLVQVSVIIIITIFFLSLKKKLQNNK